MFSHPNDTFLLFTYHILDSFSHSKVALSTQHLLDDLRFLLLLMRNCNMVDLLLSPSVVYPLWCRTRSDHSLMIQMQHNCFVTVSVQHQFYSGAKKEIRTTRSTWKELKWSLRFSLHYMWCYDAFQVRKYRRVVGVWSNARKGLYWVQKCKNQRWSRILNKQS